MPSKSPAQHRLMEGIAHGMQPRKGGPPVKVAKGFVAADKRTNGQFQSNHEKTGKVMTPQTGHISHPQSHAEFESLGHHEKY